MVIHYISTQNLGNNNHLYGTMCIVENKPFEIDYGLIKGNDLEVNEELTKRVMERYRNQRLSASLLFKYDSLDISRHMLYQFDHNKDYIDYMNETHVGLDASPSVFLSDLDHLKTLKQKMNNHLRLINYQQNRGKTF